MWEKDKIVNAMKNRLAVLIPVYNGGKGLIKTILSCGESGLESGQYEIIVVDNCSTDGWTDNLPVTDHNGAPIRLFMNDANLGRVGNWNRAIEIAEQKEFSFFTFLFVEDMWLSSTSISHMLKLMAETNAAMGMAPLTMVNEDDKLICLAKRFSIRSESVVISKNTILRESISNGHLALGPAQANIYRIYNNNKIRFDPNKPMTTDLESTVRFLMGTEDPVVFFDKPYVQWKAHKGRTFMREDPVSLIRDTILLLRELSEITGVPVKWSVANSILLLSHISAIRNFHNSHLKLYYSIVKYMMRQSESISLITLSKILINKYIFNKAILSLD